MNDPKANPPPINVPVKIQSPGFIGAAIRLGNGDYKVLHKRDFMDYVEANNVTGWDKIK